MMACDGTSMRWGNKHMTPQNVMTGASAGRFASERTLGAVRRYTTRMQRWGEPAGEPNDAVRSMVGRRPEPALTRRQDVCGPRAVSPARPVPKKRPKTILTAKPAGPQNAALLDMAGHYCNCPSWSDVQKGPTWVPV